MEHYVYFIQSKKSNSPVKIGHSSNIEKRLEDLQVGNPYKLEVKVKLPFSSKMLAISTEKLFHREGEKNHQRLNGEWFYIRSSLVEFIGNAMAYKEEMNTKDRKSKTERRKPKQ